MQSFCLADLCLLLEPQCEKMSLRAYMDTEGIDQPVYLDQPVHLDQPDLGQFGKQIDNKQNSRCYKIAIL